MAARPERASRKGEGQPGALAWVSDPTGFKHVRIVRDPSLLSDKFFTTCGSKPKPIEALITEVRSIITEVRSIGHNPHAANGTSLQFAIDYTEFLQARKQPDMAMVLLETFFLKFDLDRLPHPTVYLHSRFRPPPRGIEEEVFCERA